MEDKVALTLACLNIKKLLTGDELSFYKNTNNNKQYIYYKIKDCDFL